MPRVFDVFDYSSDHGCQTDHRIDPSEIGRAILTHTKLPTDGVIRFHSEVNSKGLFLVLEGETLKKRLLVLGVEALEKEQLTPTEELRIALDRIPADVRADVLASMGLVERPSVPADPGLPIASVLDLESIFSDPTPITYLVEPEIPEGAVVYMAGVPESGKSTLACAYGRDVAARGHGVLLLDRDRNPRSVIRGRLERLGVTADHRRFAVWDSQQKSPPPQPDNPVVIEWVKRTLLETGKSPLVILDSAVSFLEPGEDENSSKDIRALFNRCRAVTDAGGTVLLLHHPGKGGDLRGSSDFAAAADQGFILKNEPEGHRLVRLTLRVHKTRYGLNEELAYDYDGGKMLCAAPANGETAGLGGASSSTGMTGTLTSLLKENPGIGSNAFEKLASSQKIPHNKSRAFLTEGVRSGKIRVQAVGKKKKHFLCGE